MSRRFFFDDLLGPVARLELPEENAHEKRVVSKALLKAQRSPPRFKYACKYCGINQLAWFEIQPGIWRLVNKTGVLHTCIKHPASLQPEGRESK